MKSDYYVYVLFRETGHPFYVGKGRVARLGDHEREARRLDRHRDRIVRQAVAALGSLPAVKVHVGLTDAEAKSAERALIAAIGREPCGPLVNQTAGGDGVPELPAETRARIAMATSAKLKGTKRSLHTIERIRATHLAMKKVISPEQRALASARQKGRKLLPEHVAKLQGRRLSEEQKAKMRGQPRSAETRAKIGLAHLGRKRPPETGAKISARRKGVPFSAEHRANIARVAGMYARGRTWITNGEINDRVPKGAPVPHGWRLGMKGMGGDRAKGTRGRVWITDGSSTRFHDANSALPAGWRTGRCA